MSVAILVSGILNTTYASDTIVFPIQEISKLECRFQDFDTLSSNCKTELPELKTKDYKKYAKKNQGYNDYTRIYTVLWGASYKYGWDQWNGGHQWVDIATAKGTPVYSMADGTVIVANTQMSWGKIISIEHTIDGKKIVSDYAHLSAIDVKKWQKVKAGDKIGEVWSTWNSTGNHLHFQIDFDAPFYPYYYDFGACPYSYYEITEKWVCFDELAAHTIDPLLFFETNGTILEKVSIPNTSATKTTSTKKKTITQTKKTTTVSVSEDEIFYTYVYKESSKGSIREVQKVFRSLGYYDGALTGNYLDIEEIIIDYQVDKWVVPSRDSDGAGYWGPKTRARTKIDYDSFLANGGKENGVVLAIQEDEQDIDQEIEQEIQEEEGEAELAVEQKPDRTLKSWIVTEKISREWLLTKEEREKKELDDFLEVYDIKIKELESLQSVGVGQQSRALLEVQNKRGSPFRGTTPGNITFELDQSIATLFPTEFFYFDNGEREIYIKWIKEWNTTIKVKLADRVVATTRVTVESASTAQAKKKLGIQRGKIFTESKIVVGEAKTGLVLLRDAYGKKMIDRPYEWKFAVNANVPVKYCIKKWDIEDIKTIFKKKCEPDQYRDTLVFDYDDTVDGILIFEYKLFEKDAELELVKIQDGTTKLYARDVQVKEPKGLEHDYAYYDEVVETLEKWVTDWVKRGYFLEDRKLTEYDANIWIKNTLTLMRQESSDEYSQWEITKSILEIGTNPWSTRKYITREEFLDMAVKHFVLDENMIGNVSIDYKDLDEKEDLKANIFFSEDNTWKDKFWENYFRPNEKITRWEWAYFLTQVLETNKTMFLASR